VIALLLATLAATPNLSLDVPRLAMNDAPLAADEGTHTGRGVAEGLVLAGVGAASLTFFALEREKICGDRASTGGCGFELFVFQAGASALIGPLAAWGLHALAGGYGGYGQVFSGYLGGEVLWPAALIVVNLLVDVSLFNFSSIVGFASTAGLLSYAIPGIVVGSALGAYMLEYDSDQHQPGLTVHPYTNREGGGVTIAYAF
jgi:hypothetical protein